MSKYPNTSKASKDWVSFGGSIKVELVSVEARRKPLVGGIDFDRLSVGRAHVVDPNTLRFDTFTLCPKYDLKGVFSFMDECGTLF